MVKILLKSRFWWLNYIKLSYILLSRLSNFFSRHCEGDSGLGRLALVARQAGAPLVLQTRRRWKPQDWGLQAANSGYNVMRLCITYKKYTQVIPHISTRGELNWLKMPQARLGRHRSTTVLPRSTWDMQWTELQRVTTSTLSEINLNMSEHCKRSSYDWYETYRNMIGSEIHHLLVWQFLLLAPE